MTTPFTPLRNIRALSDLLILDRSVRTGDVLRIDKPPYYPEICLWVTVDCSESDLFPENDRTLVDAFADEGYGWRLGVDEHGYLYFEDHNPVAEERLRVASHIPLHAAVATTRPFRVGVCLSSSAWMQRSVPGSETSGTTQLRLFTAPESGGSISEIGGEDHIDRREMNPVPGELTIGSRRDGRRLFAGAIHQCTIYNSARLELFDHAERIPADQELPLLPGGSSFHPRWVDAATIEVFSHPEFTATTSYWIHLDLNALPERCTRLQLWTKWVGGTNMTPIFFHSPNGREWQRITPSCVAMRMGDGRNFQAEFERTGPLRGGGYLASAPPFQTEDREALLEWAAQQPHTTVTVIGTSVLRKPIHAIRLGTADDGPERHGMVVICGQHSPAEIMDGRVVRPLIEQLQRRPALLDRCTFYFVPTVNVDCQYYGGNGLNANQRNTNRHWMLTLEPETQACVDFFDKLSDAGQQIDFALDMHAGGTFRNHVLMVMGAGRDIPLADSVLAAQEEWCGLLERHAGLRRADGRALPQQKLRATDYFHQVHGAVSFCLELSLCSYFDPRVGASKPFGMEVFALLARGIADACEEKFSLGE